MLPIRRLFCFSHASVTTLISKRHARVLKGGRKVPINANFGPQDSFRDNEPEDDDVPEMSEVHAIEDQINIINPRDPEFQAESQRSDKRQREWLKRKIIEKKYFRPPKETSLLTWNAMEQIRYLNKEDPDQWTPERLAESFPISQNGVIQLLKSKFFFKTEEEIEKHDQRIRKQWFELRSQLKKGVEFVDAKYKRLLEGGPLSSIMNAGGMPALPMPPKPNLSKLVVSKPRQVGEFEAVIRGYIDSQKLKKIESKESKMILPKIDDGKVLQEISDSFTGSQWTSQGFLKTDSDAISKTADHNGIHSASNDEISMSGQSSEVKLDRLSRRQRRMAREQRDELHVDSGNFSTLQMLETRKVSHTAGNRDSILGDEIVSEDRSTVNSWAYSNDSKYMQEDPFSVTQLRERREGRNQDAKNMFEENFKKDKSSEDEAIKVSKSMREKGSFFRKGNAVYDENGELLYKIP